MSSELLGAAQNVLKGNLGGAWDINKGYADAYTDLGVARRFGGSAVAYSLRDIGAMNGRVVRVRRDSDNAEEDFSANQVASGALETFVQDGAAYNEFSGDPVKAGGGSAAITLTNVSNTGFTAEISGASGTKQINFPLTDSLVSGNDYFVSFDYTSTSTSTVGVKPRTAALGSASNDVISATNSGFYGGTGDASHNGFDVNNTATVLSFQTTANSFTFTVSNLRASRIARNGFVETWYDQSGSGNNATQSGASNQPRIIQNGGQIKLNNGTPSLGFARDNSIRHLDMASAVGASEPYTFFATTVFHGAFIFTIFAEDGNDNKPKATISATAARYFPSDSDDSGSISADGDADNIVSGFSGVNGGADGILRFNGANLKTDISRTQDGDSIQVLGRFPNTSTTLAHIESFVLFESDKTSDFSDIEKELAQPINIL